jgi:hypothetical protein
MSGIGKPAVRASFRSGSLVLTGLVGVITAAGGRKTLG